jgi:hypothetical protein
VPLTVIEGEEGLTVMVATAPGVTVKVTAMLVTPPDAAVIWVVPANAPVASPLLLMVATLVALLAQVRVTPLMVFPLVSLATAVNWSVAFTATDDEAAVTVIVAKLGVELEVEDDPPPQSHRNNATDKTNSKRFMSDFAS